MESENDYCLWYYTDPNDVKNNSEHRTGTKSKLGLKAPSSECQTSNVQKIFNYCLTYISLLTSTPFIGKYYMTVQSSSISNNNNHSSSEMCNIDMDTLVAENPTLAPEVRFTGCSNMPVSSVMVDEGK